MSLNNAKLKSWDIKFIIDPVILWNIYQLTPFKVYVNKHKTNKTNFQKPGLQVFIYKMFCDNVFVFLYCF